MRLPISPSLYLWSYMSPFLRYGDLMAKSWVFFLHSLIRRPRSVLSLEFRAEVNHDETRVMALYTVKTTWS